MRLSLLLSVLFFVLLEIIVWGFPIAFSAVDAGSSWTYIAYWLTQSGGVISTIILIVALDKRIWVFFSQWA